MMDEKVTITSIDTSELTPEIVKQMANDLFSSTRSDFDEIKNRTWYKKLLNAATLGVNDRKMTIKNVRSLANLQTLFLNLYTSQEISHDAELDDIVMNVQNLQGSVISLHRKCVLNLTNIEGPVDISRDDQQILLWFLTLINQDGVLSKEQRERYTIYNYTIKTCCNKVIQAEEKPSYDLLKNVESPKVFYRCAAEQAVYTFGEIYFDDGMISALKKLSISEEDKETINNSVIKEVSHFTIDVLLQKYELIDDDGDFEGFETEEIFTEPTPPENDICGEEEADFTKIIDYIQTAIDTGKLGKSLLKKSGDAEKEIVKLLPGILPKTIAAITKVENGNLVFTTFAMYYIEKDCMSQIKYAEVTEEKISINFHEGIFSFRSSNDKKIKIKDGKIDAKTLQRLLCDLQTIDSFPISDRAIPIKEMTEKIRIAYLRLIYYIVSASKCEDHEIYKTAAEYDVTPYWVIIKNGIEDDVQFEAELKVWKSALQYPSEETAAVLMIIDVCKILQYTRVNDDIPALSEKFFERICEFEKEKVKEKVKEKESNIIKLALAEKQFIVKQINYDMYKKVLEGFAIALGGLGISVISYNPILLPFMAAPWVAFGPAVGALFSVGIIAGSVIKNVFNQKINAEELRMRLFKEQFEDYELAIRDAQSEGYLEIVSHLQKAKELLCLNADLSYNVKIIEDDEMYEKISEKVKKCMGSAETCGSLIEKYSEKEKRRLLNDMVIPGISEKIEDVVAYYNGNDIAMPGIEKFEDVIAFCNVKILATLTGSCSGILFVKKGIYYKEDPSSHIIYISYVDIKSVIEQINYLEIMTNDNRVIKLKGVLFTNNRLPQLFNEIVDLLV